MNQGRALTDAELEANSAAAIRAIETVEPILSYDTANNLQMAIAQYEPFVMAGGWEQVPQETYGVTMGVRRDGVVQLKRRLLSSADMAMVDQVDEAFDGPTDAALRRFQARHGLQVSGQVDEPTWYALNVPAEARLHQLRLNLLRVQAMAPALADRYVVVNIPAAFIEVVEGGMVQRRHTAVVGRIDRQTPILKSRIHQINFNPFWNVPVSIIRRDLIKYMNENPNYLTEQKIRILDGNGQEVQPSSINWQTEEAVNYRFRQDPGPLNSMGNVKINFHNPHAVYLHDTRPKACSATMPVSCPQAAFAWTKCRTSYHGFCATPLAGPAGRSEMCSPQVSARMSTSAIRSKSTPRISPLGRTVTVSSVSGTMSTNSTWPAK